MGVEECLATLAGVLEPAPRLTISEWADANRRLTSESSAEQGQWDTSRAPFQRAWMDALSPHSGYESVVLMTSSQIGKTELLNNTLGFVIDVDPGPVLVVMPTLDLAKSWSKDRLTPMIAATPSLSGKVADVRARDSDNTTLHKRFPGGRISVVGANSTAGLSARPIRYVLLDEVDRYPAGVSSVSGAAEGDPVSLAIKRTATFWNRKILLCSSPTVKGASRIEAAYRESNQSRFWVPCPLCDGMQVLEFRRLEWPKGEPHGAQYRCQHCERLIDAFRKPQMLARGEWRAENPESKTAGFWISQCYSPWVNWGETAAEFLKAKSSPETLRAFLNTALAELWDDERETIGTDEKGLLARREILGPQVPTDACILTAGVDVQDNRLEVEIVGWSPTEQSWGMDYRVLPGDPSGVRLWQELDEYLLQPWRHQSGATMRICAACVDSGGHHTNAVYHFCSERWGRRVFAIKGQGGAYPVWPRQPSRNTIAKHPVWLVGVDSAKATVMSRLRVSDPAEPGYSHFSQSRDQNYLEQLTSEYLRTEYRRGVAVRNWVRKQGRQAEALDCRVYAFAALEALKSMGVRLDRQAQLLVPADPTQGQHTAPASRPVRFQMSV